MHCKRCNWNNTKHKKLNYETKFLLNILFQPHIRNDLSPIFISFKQMNRVYGEMVQMNETLYYEIGKIAKEKSNDKTLQSYHEYDVGEYSRLSSLLKVYAKKDAIEDLMTNIEEIESNLKLLSDQKNKLEIVGNLNTYSNDRFNETLQDIKQVS